MDSSSLRSASAAERVRRLGLIALLGALCACSAARDQRASIEDVRRQRSAGLDSLLLQQRLDFSPRMLEALSHGIALRLDYALSFCDGRVRTTEALWLRYYPLAREFEARWQGEDSGRRFARRGALLASLDQVRLPLPDAARRCAGQVSLSLAPEALPAPLRFPALIGLQDWRLASAPFSVAAVQAP
jgi:hypothetical protein